jgi:D-arabinose 1-dehydrogenase-like Zn-dependent alcohol dehydrogenase
MGTQIILLFFAIIAFAADIKGRLTGYPITNFDLCYVVIKVAYTGICGSDIHTFKGEYKNPTTPVVLGHEFSGQVVAVGDNVTKVKA